MDYSNDARQKLTELTKSAKLGMLTTVTQSGELHSRPMGLQDIEFDGDLWFFTYQNSNKIAEIASNPAVNVSFNDSSNSWVSIYGTAQEVHDQDKAKELWSPLLKAWFPDGLETEGLTLIKVRAESAEYWDSHNSKALQLFGMAKAAVTGKQPDAGENKTLAL